MQQVLNSQERNQAFLKFLLFFLVTVVLIILAIFYNYRMPTREKAMLQEEVDTKRLEEDKQQKFVTRMEDALLLLDSLDKKNVNFEQVASALNAKLADLSIYQQKDNTLYGKMNKVVVDKLNEILKQKRELLKASDASNRINTLEANLIRCQDQLTSAQGLLDGWRNKQQPGTF